MHAPPAAPTAAPHSDDGDDSPEKRPNQRRIRLHCATFNLGGRAPPAPLPLALLGLDPLQWGGANSSQDGGGDPPDLLAFATQETASVPEWEAALRRALAPRGYGHAGSVSLRAISLSLWARRGGCCRVARLCASSVATGLGNVVGNKGSVALSATLAGGLRLLFVGSHFAAHDDRVARRNADFARTCKGLFRGEWDGKSAAAGGGDSARLHLPAADGLATRAGPSDGGGDGAPAGGLFRIGSAVNPRFSFFGSIVRRNRVVPAAAADDDGGDVSSSSGGWPTAGRLPLAGRALGLAGGMSRSASTVRSWLSPGGSSSGGGGGGGTSSYLSSDGGGYGGASCGSGGVSCRDGGGGATGVVADATDCHDAVFWMGDLNYRINGGRRVVAWLLRGAPLLLPEVLHANDQLRLQRRRGAAFAGYEEGEVGFAPTFKVARGGEGPSSSSSSYSHSSYYSPARAPAWTDRVLWKVNAASSSSSSSSSSINDPPCPCPCPLTAATATATAVPTATTTTAAVPTATTTTGPLAGAAGAAGAAVAVRQRYYDSVTAAATSDHKPVVAGFELKSVGGGGGVGGGSSSSSSGSSSSSSSSDSGGDSGGSRSTGAGCLWCRRRCCGRWRRR